MLTQGGTAAAVIDELGAWLRQAAWPLWLAHGIDREAGGFYEALDLETRRCQAPFRRLRVAARQVFVFSRAHDAGVPGAADAVALGLRFLRRHAALPGGGYAWRFDTAHRVTDATRDLYDNAFVLLALAAAAAVPGADTAAEARALLAHLDAHFRHPEGGYVESLPLSLPRRQNPHMHLLEALHEAAAAFGDAIFLDRAEALVRVFLDRLLDRQTGALPEFFDDAWRPEQRHGRFLVEPGHHAEWVWLLHRHAALVGASDERALAAARLSAFLDRADRSPAHGELVDLLDSAGKVVSPATRLWPQAEYLKAALLRADATEARSLAASRNLARYLRPDGLWHERRDAAGCFTHEPAPASTLYHLTSAILTAEAAQG